MTVKDTIIDFYWKRGFNIKMSAVKVLFNIVLELADKLNLTGDDMQKLLEESANGSK